MRRISSNVRDVLPLLTPAQPQKFVSGVLATLVHTEGSAYQKAGAQLFVNSSGDIYGLVSGGCLEQAIVDEALTVLKGETTQLRTYDSGDPEDLEFGFGLGCGGKLWIFFEKMDEPEALQQKILGLTPRASIEAIALEAEQASGERYFYHPDLPGAQLSPLQSLLRETALSLPREQRSLLVRQTLAERHYTIALLRRPARPHLTIFGAGPGAWPLARLASSISWDLRVMDHRPAYLDDFPAQLAAKSPLYREQSSRLLPEGFELSAALIMTHNFSMDRQILQQLLQESWSYIGLIGSNKRCSTLLLELRAMLPQLLGDSLPPQLYAPAGLNLGGDDVEAIGLAIMAEIQAALHKKAEISFRRRSTC